MTGQLAKVVVVPRWLDTAEHTGRRLAVIPADAEPVAVCRLRAQAGVQALVDQGMCWGKESIVDQYR